MCGVSACTEPAPHYSQCNHHSDKGHSSGKACQHPDSDLFSPEGSTELAKLAVFHFTGVIALPCSDSIAALEVKPASEILQRSEHYMLPATSVLALLSTFRI